MKIETGEQEKEEGGRWEVAQEKFCLTYWVIAALYAVQAQVVSPGKTLPQVEVEGVDLLQKLKLGGSICSQKLKLRG